MKKSTTINESPPTTFIAELMDEYTETVHCLTPIAFVEQHNTTPEEKAWFLLNASWANLQQEVGEKVEAKDFHAVYDENYTAPELVAAYDEWMHEKWAEMRERDDNAKFGIIEG